MLAFSAVSSPLAGVTQKPSHQSSDFRASLGGGACGRLPAPSMVIRGPCWWPVRCCVAASVPARFTHGSWASHTVPVLPSLALMLLLPLTWPWGSHRSDSTPSGVEHRYRSSRFPAASGTGPETLTPLSEAGGVDLEAQVWAHGGVHGSWASVGPRQGWGRCVCVYACVSVHIYTLLLPMFISVPGP